MIPFSSTKKTDKINCQSLLSIPGPLPAAFFGDLVQHLVDLHNFISKALAKVACQSVFELLYWVRVLITASLPLLYFSASACEASSVDMLADHFPSKNASRVSRKRSPLHHANQKQTDQQGQSKADADQPAQDLKRYLEQKSGDRHRHSQNS